MLKTNIRGKSAISIKTFISEFGENFTSHMDERLMELSPRCFLTRREVENRLDLKHVEHIKYDCFCDKDGNTVKCKKEYAYGEFEVLEGNLYFSDGCLETNEITKSPEVSIIYDSLDSEGMTFDENRNLKKVNDDNIDYVVDSILSVCPKTSQAYRDIVKGMISRADNK